MFSALIDEDHDFQEEHYDAKCLENWFISDKDRTKKAIIAYLQL